VVGTPEKRDFHAIAATDIKNIPYQKPGIPAMKIGKSPI
jgi:hypothetical protein